jgi:membrane protease YdiL (CAAX protease family)
MKEKLRGRDFRFIAVCALLLAGTVWFSVLNFHRAFPEASIDFRVNRDEGEALAGRFLASQGYKTADFREASSFTYDDDAKTFLEREAGLEQANRIMSTRVHLWRWSYRWFRPLQKEEYRADVTPQGVLAGFGHEIAEDAPRPAIDAAAARAKAEEFLRARVHRDPASLDFVEVSEVVRPHRVDRVFTWKERDFNLHDATNRLEVGMLGSEVGGFREYLKVPDQWKRDYQRLRSKNEVASTVDSAALVLMLVGLIVVIVIRVRKHDIRWHQAAWVGGIGMALSFCSALNQLPLEQFNYPTTDSYASFMMRQLLQGVISSLGAGGLLFVLAAAAEPLYREAFPERISLGNLFLLRGLRTKRFLLGCILGITLTGIFIAYQTGFYMVAYRFGAWSPADVPYSDLLNTKFPWAFVLFGGFLPAVSEEFLFRMFGIPFARKLVRSTAVAIVIAGFVWGFGHAAYPQQPFYIRGVEVGVGGVVLGLVMLRWGILPTLVWHYSVDAMYSAMLLFRSHSLYFKLSGAASAGIVVLPVIIALVAYWKRGGFEPETGLLNGDEPAPLDVPAEPQIEAPAEVAATQPLSAGTRWAAAGLAVLGIAALAIPVQRFGASPKYAIGAEQARAAADAFLRTRHLDPAAFRQVTFPDAHSGGDDSLAAKYFLEHGSVATASALFQANRPVQHWVTRYFKSLDKEEAIVSVQPETSRVLAWNHTLPEDRPGADLPEDTARGIAATFAGGLGLNPAAMDLKESNSEKKKARRDYTFVWEARAGDPRNLADGRYRLEVEVAGDQASSIRSYWHLPEAFTRLRSQQNFISIPVMAIRFGLLSTGVVAAIWLLLAKIRKGQVPWRRVMRISIPVTLLTAVGPLLSMKLMLQGYNTAIPLQTYEAMTYLIVAMSVLFGFVIVGGAAALICAYYPDSAAMLRAGSRRQAGRDALVALIAAAGIAMLSHQLQLLILGRFPGSALFSIGSPDLIVSAVPALAAVSGAIRSVLIFGAALAAAVLVVSRLRSRWMVVALSAVAPFLLLPLDIRTPGEFALQYTLAALSLTATVVLCRYFARGNYLAYALVLWLLVLRAPLGDLLGNPYPAYQIQGFLLAFAGLDAVAWAILPAFRKEPRQPLPAVAAQ